MQRSARATRIGLAVMATAAIATAALLVACAGATGAGKAGPTTGGAPGQSPPGQAAGGGAKPDVNGLAGEAPARGDARPQGPAGEGGSVSDAGELPLPSQVDQRIIMVSTLSVTVRDVSAAFEDAGAIAAAAGGFVASSSFGHQDGQDTATVTLRVPGHAYADALARLRKLGDVEKEDSNTNDVTEQYTDLQSRLRSLQAALQQYLQFLARAGNIGEVLQVQDRINQTQAEIEQVQGRVNMLEHQTDLATITVHLDPPAVAKQPKAGGGPLEAAKEAFRTSLVVLMGAATVGLAVAAFSWWLVPVGAVGWYVAQRQLRASRSRHEAPE
jgi:hypothetical protein